MTSLVGLDKEAVGLSPDAVDLCRRLARLLRRCPGLDFVPVVHETYEETLGALEAFLVSHGA